MDEKYKKDLENRIIDCILRQVFLEVRFPGIKKISFFKEILSLEELILFNVYEKLVLGKLREISKKLDCNFSDYSSYQEVVEDLKYLEENQAITNRFFLKLQDRVRQRMTIAQRIKFFWENIKVILSDKGEGTTLPPCSN